MTKAEQLIKRLEEETGKKLPLCKFEDLVNTNLGYSVDETGYITGLCLYDLKIADYSFLPELSHLQVLDLISTQVSDLTPLKGLTNLTELYLSGTQVSDLTPLKGLTNLKELLLENNKINQLPEAIVDLGMKIHVESYYDGSPGLWLKGNPLESPPIEIVKQGNEAIKAWFKAQREEEKRALNEVKVVLVGDGAAGKTSLIKRLMGKDFNPDESQTHGININRWKIQVNDTDITVHLWDFGGQEIMHATHQFFLSKRSLYILVLDGRRDDKTEYWLKHIRSFGGSSPAMVVINKMDQNPGFDVNRPFLIKKYQNIKGFFRTSCKSADGIATVDSALKEQLAGLEMLTTSWAESWFNVKTHLETMTHHYISYKQYNRICREKKVADDSRTVLLEYLNDLGIVLNFKDFDLSGLHVLEPKWVTQAVYKIINSEAPAQCHGQLRLAQLDAILAKKKKEDYDYPRDTYGYIIGLMKKFELCYRLQSTDETLLIPDLLPIGEPSFAFPYAESLSFIIQYQFLPPSVMPRFIVNMHQDIESEELQWRTGVVLLEKNFQCRAVVKADNDAKRIYIDVAGGRKRDYFAVLLATLRRINHSFQQLKTTELVPMPDDPEITANYKQLIQFEEEGIDTYRTGESDKKYKVKDLLGTIAKENATEAEMLEILRKLVDEKDKDFLDGMILQPTIFGMGFDLKTFLRKLTKKKKTT